MGYKILVFSRIQNCKDFRQVRARIRRLVRIPYSLIVFAVPAFAMLQTGKIHTCGRLKE